MKYPFTPKSTSYLEPGHYWPTALSDGKYACGVVVSKLIDIHENKIESRLFLAALIDWTGRKPPTAEDIKDCKAIKVGGLHIKSITTAGVGIIGKANFCFLGQNPRQITDDLATMGYNVLKVVAEKHFTKNS